MTTEARTALRIATARRYARSGEGHAIRVRHGLSLSEIARPTGVTPPTVWRWEHGKSMPRGEAAVAWLGVLEALEGQS